MSYPKLFSMLLGTTLLATASTAVAGEKTIWVGTDPDNPRIKFTCSNVGGDNWVLEQNGKTSIKYDGIRSTNTYVELQLKGVKEFARVRVYKDKLQMNEDGSKTVWITIAKGKWSN